MSYAEIWRKSEAKSWFSSRRELFKLQRHYTSHEIKKMLFEKLPSDMTSSNYESTDSVLETDETTHYPVQFLQPLTPSGLSQHIPCLKIGAPQKRILLRNNNPPKLQ